MKTFNKKTSTAVALGLLLGASTFAQDSLVADIDQNVLNQQQIDVDGQFSRPDPLEKMRNDLAKQHNKMVDQKINNMRIKSEKKLGQDLMKAFSGELQPVVDTVQTGQAAVVKAEVKPVDNDANKEMRIIPQIGYSAISGETIRGEMMDFESKINIGIQFDADVHNHISVGVGVGYQALDITDFSNSYYSNQFYDTYGSNMNWYSNMYGTGRELNSKQLSVDITSKFYATGKDARFRPYIGLGVGFAHLMLSYANTAQTQAPMTASYGAITYGNEQFSSNFITGSIALGTLVNFSSTIGMNIELAYSKGVTSSFSENSGQVMQNFDQLRLNELGDGMSSADVASVKAGLTVGF